MTNPIPSHQGHNLQSIWQLATIYAQTPFRKGFLGGVAPAKGVECRMVDKLSET